MTRGAPFLASTESRVEKIVELADVKKGKLAADLGSGDGRIVIAFAKAGVEAHGYEINPLLVLWARYRVRRAGLSGRAFIHWKSFWRQNFSKFDIIAIYGIPYIMRGLESKLKKEIKQNARIVSGTFTFPTWRYSKEDGEVYLYEKNQQPLDKAM